MTTPRGRAARDYGRYGSVGIELVLSLLVGLWLGHKGDEKFGTGPWLTLLGIVVGLYAGFRALWKVSQVMVKEAEREIREEEQARAAALADPERKDEGPKDPSP